MWTLPSAHNSQGVLLILPDDFSLYDDVISRWESITLNLINDKQFQDNKAKVLFIENLLREVENKIWIQWRMVYENEYEALVNITDDPHNVLSQIRRIILLEDPYQGSTEEQTRAYLDLERLSWDHIKNIFNYMNDYKGYLDEQFYQLEDLQDDVSPNFVEEVVTLFFKDSSRLLSNIEQALEKNSPDFEKLDSLMHQCKGSTSSIGALRVKNECTLLREYCNKENLDGCLRTFQKVKREHAILKQKLEAYFQLLRQIGPAEGATRPVI